ncbi:MAG: flagellar protein FlaG [Gammaproteobacteria bacterium]
MATEITTQVKQVVSHSVNRLRNQEATVTAEKPAAPAATRQGLPGSVQSAPAASDSGQTTQTQGRVIDQARLNQAVNDLNSFVQNVRRELRFSIDDNSGKTIIKVIDSESQEVVRQIPPEDVVNITQHLNVRSGVLLQASV